MKVEKGKKIKMDYELSVEGGEVIESSSRRGPIEYVHGEGKMLPGLESRIDGLEVGQEKEGVVPAAEAYGTVESLPTRTISSSEFPGSGQLQVGTPFTAKDQEGNPIQFTVVEIKDDQVTVRFDHPLAGKDLRFKVKILDISDPK
jgi:FKBP-type peptidyl-prolyl cis-trans isomerase SlyD